MRKEPLLLAFCFFVSGIFFQDFFLLNGFWSVSVVSAGLLFSLLCSFGFFLHSRNFSILFFFFGLGIFLHHLNQKKEDFPHFENRQNIVFRMQKKLNSSEKNKRYEVVCFVGNQSFTAVLSYPKSENDLDFQHDYSASAYVNTVGSPDNDFVFDYRKYLERKHIYYQVYLPDGFVSRKRNHLSFSEKIQQERLNVLFRIDSSELSERNRNFLKGIILADRTEMDQETVQDFTKTGLVHILAISGSHMVIIFWLVYFVFGKIFYGKKRKLAVLFSLSMIWAFTVFIDYGNSVVRSCIMITAYYIYVLLERKPDLLHSMSLAGFVILIWDTQQLFDVGFQLSFAAVFGIYWLNRPILRLFRFPRSKFEKYFQNIISITLSAQLATFPLVIYYFHQFPFVSIFANLIAIPLAELVIVGSFLMVIVIALGIHLHCINIMYDFLADVFLQTVHWFARFESLFAENIPLNLYEMILLFGMVYFLRFLLEKFSFRNILAFTFLLFLFYGFRLYFDAKSYLKEDAFVSHYYRKPVFMVKEKGKVVIWLEENQDREKVEKYLIQPYLVSRRCKDFSVKTLPKNTDAILYKNQKFELK